MPCPTIVSPRSPVSVLDWQRLILKSDLTPAEKCCAVALATFINSKSGLAWPSMATLGAAAGLSEQTARRAVHKLQSLGLVQILERTGRSNRYMLGLGVVEDTPIRPDSPPLSPEIPELPKERTIPPLPPEGLCETQKEQHPTPQTPRARLERSVARQPHRRSRRTPEPLVFAGCHRPADPQYLAPPPPRTMPVGALAGLRGALRS